MHQYKKRVEPMADNRYSKKEHAQQAIDNSLILDKLSDYKPAVVSTIFVGLDTASSDIDIICSYNTVDSFSRTQH